MSIEPTPVAAPRWLCYHRIGLVVFAIAFVCGHGAHAAFTFQGLGVLPEGDDPVSFANAISADGSTVVGRSDRRPFRWSQATGMVPLAAAPEVGARAAVGVSSDGSVIAIDDGQVWINGTIADVKSIINRVMGVSANGEYIVGAWDQNPSHLLEARVWKIDQIPPIDEPVSLGNLSGGTGNSVAAASSADGSVVVGLSSSPNACAICGEAFRWTEQSGMVGLGDLPGGYFGSAAQGVSQDGSVIVGYGTSAADTPGSATREASRWTQATGMVGLGRVPGGLTSNALAVSADGSVIVGEVGMQMAPLFRAFVWDTAHGMRNLKDFLINTGGLGSELAGWVLERATGVSSDGRRIVGNGINPQGRQEAWVATIELTTPALSGDYNNNGMIDAADYVAWRDKLGQSVTLPNDPTPGIVSQTDYDVWQRSFGTALGTFASNAAPEPATWVLLIGAVAMLIMLGKRNVYPNC
jgi:uncharacterized membrane protein